MHIILWVWVNFSLKLKKFRYGKPKNQDQGDVSHATNLPLALCPFFNRINSSFFCICWWHSETLVAHFQDLSFLLSLFQPLHFFFAQMDQQRDFVLTQMRKSIEKLGSSAEVSSVCCFSCGTYSLCLPSSTIVIDAVYVFNLIFG